MHFFWLASSRSGVVMGSPSPRLRRTLTALAMASSEAGAVTRSTRDVLLARGALHGATTDFACQP